MLNRIKLFQIKNKLRKYVIFSLFWLNKGQLVNITARKYHQWYIFEQLIPCGMHQHKYQWLLKRSKWYNFNKFIKFQQNQDFVTKKKSRKKWKRIWMRVGAIDRVRRVMAKLSWKIFSGTSSWPWILTLKIQKITNIWLF